MAALKQFLTTLVLSGFLGFSLSAQEMHSMEHMHVPVALPDDAQIPGIEAQIFEDQKSGYNLHLNLENFKISSPQFSGEFVDNIVEGHAHLYVNGKKIQRLYGTDVHLPKILFQAGINQISVSLNDHDHKTWTINQQNILATIFIDTTKEQWFQYHFSSSPLIRQ